MMVLRMMKNENEADDNDHTDHDVHDNHIVNLFSEINIVF